MANQRKLIGRLPVFKGEWSSLETYNKLNEVTLYGSSFRSKIDGNTYKPAELNSSGTGMTVNENWYVVANGTDAYLAGEKIASIDGNTSTYNVSRFHQHTGFWEAVEYDESEPAYLEAQEYKAGNRVNLVNYTNHTFVAMKDMTGVMPDYNNISNKFTLEEAILFVPSKYRLTGMNVGFLDSSNKPVVHKHKGGTFTNVANWEEDVHEKLAELSSELGSIVNYIYGYYTSSADGILIYSISRCTTAYFQGNYDITLNDGYRIENIVAYDLTGNFLKRLGINDDKTGLLTRITFAKTDDSVFNGNEQAIKSLHFIDNNIFIGTYNITDTPDSQQTTFASISVKKGSYINIKPKSDGSWNRLLIGINGNNSDRLFDYMENDKDYYHYCDKDISSFWVYVVGLTGNLEIELNVGLTSVAKKQPQIDEDIKSVKNNLTKQLGSIVNYIYGYYTSSADGELAASNNSNRTTTGFLSGAYNYTLNEGYTIENIVAYDLTGTFLKRLNSTTEITNDMLIRFSFKKSDDSSFVGDEKIIKSLEKKILGNVNALSEKSYTSLGDSFSHGDFANAGEDGNTTPDTEFNDEIYDYDWEMYKTYPWWIAKRNNMKLTNLAVNGAKLIDYANEEKLNQIPVDSDYISLKFGINDSHQSVPIGDIDSNDTTTFYGAWNYILTWLITNRQNAKIGLIASNGCDTIEYSNATVEIAKKYGLLCINEEGEEVPYFYRQTFKVQKQNIPSSIVSIRTSQYKVSSKNGHPNVKAHEFESTFIESFLRSL